MSGLGRGSKMGNMLRKVLSERRGLASGRTGLSEATTGRAVGADPAERRGPDAGGVNPMDDMDRRRRRRGGRRLGGDVRTPLAP